MIPVEPHRPLHPHAFSASTEGLALCDKVDYWRGVSRTIVVGLQVEPRRGQAFDAAVTGTRLKEISISRIGASAHDARHAGSGVSAGSDDRLVFNFVLAGRMQVEQDGRSSVVTAGDGALCDAARPYLLSFDQPFEVACVTLDRSALANRAAGLGRTTAISFAQTSELSAMVFGYVSGLARSASHLSVFGSEKVSRNFSDLLAAMVDEAIQASPLPLSEYRGVALLRVKEFVEHHLCDSALDPASVAAALKLSPRYINQLLEAEGTSLSRHIWRRRIERAAADLRNPGLRSNTISTIAMANGFNDLGHFSKAFRQRFAMSPRAYRVASTAELQPGRSR